MSRYERILATGIWAGAICFFCVRLATAAAVDGDADTYEGIIVRVESKVLDVRIDDDVKEFNVVDQTMINVDGRPAEFKHLKLAYKVEIEAQEVAGEMVANRIDATSIRKE